MHVLSLTSLTSNLPFLDTGNPYGVWGLAFSVWVGDYVGSIVGVLKGDISTSDYSSHDYARMHDAQDHFQNLQLQQAASVFESGPCSLELLSEYVRFPQTLNCELLRLLEGHK